MKPADRAVSARKRLRYKLDVALLRSLAWVIQRFPRGFVRKLGHALGWATYHVAGKHRKIALANLDVAYGDSKSPKEKERIARACMQNFAATFLTMFWSPRLTQATVREYIEVDEEAMKAQHEILSRGRGLIFVTLHFGDWELLGQTSALFGIPLTVVMEELRNAKLAEFLSDLREQTGNRLISQNFATAKLMKALKRGEGVALLIDLNSVPRLGGVWLKFFEMPVFNSATAAILSLRTGAPLVGAAAIPLPNGRCRIVCSREITVPPTGNEEADILALSQKCSDFCESVVREHPDYWLWTYKRWKFRPTDEQGRYPFYSVSAKGRIKTTPSY
jgi:lauroyl/myristoyl acyltransferase